MSYYLIIFILLVLALLASNYYSHRNKKIIENKKLLEAIDNKNIIIRTLVKQAAKMSLIASRDKNPMMAMIHSDYSAGYLMALQDIATIDEISKSIGMDYNKIKNQIIKIQDANAKKINIR